jgi:hypothetical protein
MKILVAVFRELAGLVVDDGSLALAIIAIVACAAVLSNLMPQFPLATGALLLLGCLGALLANVTRVAAVSCPAPASAPARHSNA